MKSDTVLLATKEVEAMGVSRYAKSRALKALQEAGLIEYQSQRGKFPSVRVISKMAP